MLNYILFAHQHITRFPIMSPHTDEILNFNRKNRIPALEVGIFLCKFIKIICSLGNNL